MCELTFVARQTDGLILTETWGSAMQNRQLGPFKNQAKEILKRMATAPPRSSYESDPYVFHCIARDGIVYMTLCAKSYPDRLAFIFLEEIESAFEDELKRTFGTHSVDYRSNIETIEKPYFFIKFDKVIQRQKLEYEDPKSHKSLVKLKQSLHEVTAIMRQNIDEIVQRGENLEVTSQRAASLRVQSGQFRSVTQKLSFQAMLQKYAPLLAIVLVMVLVLVWKLVLSKW
eukprot:GHVN01104695.1.p1 GENE.GHVN01104695.1~~GHVN01104695.1.p1  ORF type:complete len:229 (-),score=30.25 GHVN01104695.1:257-943(-)